MSRAAFYIDFIERATQNTGETLDRAKLGKLADEWAMMAIAPTGEEALKMYQKELEAATQNRAETRLAKRIAAKALRRERRAEKMRRKRSRRNAGVDAGKGSRKSHKPCDRPAPQATEPIPIAA